VQKVFTLTSPKKHSMRAIDAKILDELEMLYGDKDCFYPLREWFGTAEVHWANLERLFMVADYAKKHNPSVAEKITAYSRRIIDLFHQTMDYASGWDSERKEKHRLSTEDYVEATDHAFLPSLLLLSPTSSSRLMTLRFMTASALRGLSTGILFSTRFLSPHLSTDNNVFSNINPVVARRLQCKQRVSCIPSFVSVISLHC